VKVGDHADKIGTDLRYTELCAAVDAAAAAMDKAFEALIKEYPLDEENAIYCVFGDGHVRPTHTTSTKD